MAKTIARARQQGVTRLDWRRRISDHIAFGLLAYTGLHIFVTAGAMASETHSILPYLALIVLVAGVIPLCRWFEKRWEAIGDDAAADPALAPQFWREVSALWLVAIGLPFALTGLFKLVLATA